MLDLVLKEKGVATEKRVSSIQFLINEGESAKEGGETQGLRRKTSHSLGNRLLHDDRDMIEEANNSKIQLESLQSYNRGIA